MSGKKQLLMLAVALAGMATLSALAGQKDGAILCSVMAGIGGLIVAFGFRKGFRCTCVECGDGVFLPVTEAGEARASLQTVGWHFNDSQAICPACVKRGQGTVPQHVPQ